MGLGDTLVASAVAAYVTARRAASVSAREALVSAAVDNPPLGEGAPSPDASFWP